ncbi:uncharacterized protein TNCV_2762071 [Trichonephila clavipes]|nr:uncharacterized protein TNCV_2762071 [Trichonephila clavipes]
MPSEVPIDRWEGVDGLQFVCQPYPIHALLDSSPVSMLPNSHGDILRLKAIVYNVYMVRSGVVIHKQKFITLGAPKQTYMLLQNDIPIDVVCHRYTLYMQVSSGTKNISSPNEPSCTTVTVSFNDVLLVPGALHIKVRRESDFKLNQDSSENITLDHCCGVHNGCSLHQVNRRQQ